MSPNRCAIAAAPPRLRAALADAGIADHDRARGLPEGFQLPFATYEPLARNAPTHSAIIHTGLARLKERGER